MTNDPPMELEEKSEAYELFTMGEDEGLYPLNWISALATEYEQEHDWKKDDDPGATQQMLAEVRFFLLEAWKIVRRDRPRAPNA